ncbi:MAG: hypothetical protein VKJ02_04860 [Snowella sp.]|nr:hypothetical protein [Snowella sp.]
MVEFEQRLFNWLDGSGRWLSQLIASQIADGIGYQLQSEMVFR